MTWSRKISVRWFSPQKHLRRLLKGLSMRGDRWYKTNISPIICSPPDGNGGMKTGSCPNRAESSSMNTTSKSLVLVNYFRDVPDVTQACKDNSAPLLSMVNTCYEAAGKR